MGEPEFESHTVEVFRYLIERLRKVESENENLRASEARCRQYLEQQLEDLEPTEKEAQAIRDLLYPAVENSNA